jgi:two-component system response regulator PilR (NtrC family)
VIEVGDLSLKGARLADSPPMPTEAPVPSPAPAAPVTQPPSALSAAHPAPSSAPPGADELPNNLPDYLAQVERDIILRALNQTQFNRTQAATLLGISVRQLRYQMQKLEIHAPEP